MQIETLLHVNLTTIVSLILKHIKTVLRQKTYLVIIYQFALHTSDIYEMTFDKFHELGDLFFSRYIV